MLGQDPRPSGEGSTLENTYRRRSYRVGGSRLHFDWHTTGRGDH